MKINWGLIFAITIFILESVIGIAIEIMFVYGLVDLLTGIASIVTMFRGMFQFCGLLAYDNCKKSCLLVLNMYNGIILSLSCVSLIIVMVLNSSEVYRYIGICYLLINAFTVIFVMYLMNWINKRPQCNKVHPGPNIREVEIQIQPASAGACEYSYSTVMGHTNYYEIKKHPSGSVPNIIKA